MEFLFQEFLNEDIFRRVNEIKAFHPKMIEREADVRTKPGFPHDKLVFAAADHNARMINEYKGHPIGLSNRKEYLSRLVRILESSEVDGVEATPDIIEDLILINKLFREAGNKAFLDGKMLIGTVNRGGLKDTAWEMDDFCSCFTVERIKKLNLDGVKFMLRINPQDKRSKNTLEYCARAVDEAERCGFPIFIEALYVETAGNKYIIKTDTESLCKVTGVVGAVGCTSANKWIELPLNKEYQIPTNATTCPVLVVPDEREEDFDSVVKEYTKEIGLNYNIRGILLGRNVMFNTFDPLPAAEAIACAWHSDNN